MERVGRLAVMRSKSSVSNLAAIICIGTQRRVQRKVRPSTENVVQEDKKVKACIKKFGK